MQPSQELLPPLATDAVQVPHTSAGSQVDRFGIYTQLSVLLTFLLELEEKESGVSDRQDRLKNANHLEAALLYHQGTPRAHNTRTKPCLELLICSYPETSTRVLCADGNPSTAPQSAVSFLDDSAKSQCLVSNYPKNTEVRSE